MNPHTQPLSCDPVLDVSGEIYCSPACGCKCTKAAYDNAVNEAYKLAKCLGDSWQPRVWENAGWHFSATSGICEVAPPVNHSLDPRFYSSEYFAYLNSTICQTIGRDEDPVVAVAKAVLELRDLIKTTEDELMNL